MWKLRQSHRKRESQLVRQIRGWIKWKDVDQTVKTSSFKITKFWKPNVQHQYKIKLKIYWARPHQPEQDSVSPQPFPPIRKLPQASYPHPSEGRQNENHNHRKLTELITWITALSNSMKLWAMSCTATQDRWVMLESSDKTWSTGEGNSKPLQHSCLENAMNSMKRQKDMTLRDDLPKSVGAHYAPGEEQRAITNSSRKMKWLSQRRNVTQLWMCLVVKIKSNVVKNNIA